MSPLPRRCSAPIPSRIVRLSTRVATRKLKRAGKFALMMPVMTSTLWGGYDVHLCYSGAVLADAGRAERDYDNNAGRVGKSYPDGQGRFERGAVVHRYGLRAVCLLTPGKTAEDVATLSRRLFSVRMDHLYL
jgi:hypothetical protein